MSEQDKTEIRKIIKEEIEAKFSISTTKKSTEVKEPLKRDSDRRNVYVETVSPTY
jgi:hypothetical protein